jgi:hypothetical protein
MRNCILLAAGLVALVQVATVTGMGEGTKKDTTTARKTVMIEDFESYTSDAQGAKAWYKPPHGGGIRHLMITL